MIRLNLVLTAKWFDMIAKGIKKEEYRAINQYWINRLCVSNKEIEIKHFDEVCFHRGYTKTTMVFNIEDITIGEGRKEWGAPDKEVFIIKLGNRLI